MNEYNKFILFDRAVKRMLRDKANYEVVTNSTERERSGNFGVLEGQVQVLIGELIKIVEIQQAHESYYLGTSS